jgi:hypothetical protein
MTKTKRWLDELPLESCERELLLVGKSARPAPGAIDANWQALSVALGATAVSGVATSSIAANAVSAKVGTSIVASKAASAGLLLAAAKSLAVGAAVGLAVMGAGAVAERSSRSNEGPAGVAKPTQAASTPRATAEPAAIAARVDEVAVAPVTSAPFAASGLPAPRERFATSNPALNQADAPAHASPPDKAASLSQQARELAELKRLIDNGATSEALRRLPNFGGDAVSVLSEERDALYVQALARAQRREEARAFARRFLIRYPHSPYFETMRQLLTEE